MNWKLVTTNRNPLLIYELKMAGFRLGFRRVISYDYDSLKWDRGSIYCHVPTQAGAAKVLRDAYASNASSVDHILSEEGMSVSRLLRVSKHLAHIRSSNPENLLKGFQRYSETFPFATVFLMINVILGTVIEECLGRLILSRPQIQNSEEKKTDCLLGLAAGAATTRTAIADKILRAMSTETDSRRRSRMAEDFVRKYSWLSLEDGFGSPLTREDVLLRAQNMTLTSPRTGGGASNETHDTRSPETWITLLGLSPAERVIVDHFQRIVFLRTHLNDEINRCGLIARPFFLRLAKQLGVTYDLLFYARSDEIETALLKGARLVEHDLLERRSGYAIVMENGKLRMYWGATLRMLDERPQAAAPAGTVFRGQVACKGDAFGPARIILKPDEMGKLRQGDILVAGAITPDYVSGIRRASGIAADVGGMNSHAAIFSREFGIPCVIGLENASTLLRDGDLLRLDANVGTLTKEHEAVLADRDTQAAH